MDVRTTKAKQAPQSITEKTFIPGELYRVDDGDSYVLGVNPIGTRTGDTLVAVSVDDGAGWYVSNCVYVITKVTRAHIVVEVDE